MTGLLVALRCMVLVFIGAFFISDTIRAMQRRKYFRFGVDIMMVIYIVLAMAVTLLVTRWQA